MPWFNFLTSFACVAFPLPDGHASLPPVTSFLQLWLVLYFEEYFLAPQKICLYLSFFCLKPSCLSYTQNFCIRKGLYQHVTFCCLFQRNSSPSDRSPLQPSQSELLISRAH